MAEVILLVFEGEKTEPQIFKNIQQHFFSQSSNSIVRAIYDAEVYQLWKIIAGDPDLDLIEVLKERDRNNKNPELQELDRERVAQVYLFFDHDAHATQASCRKIEEMLQHFDEETEGGKLFISYPMVEALRESLSGDFQTRTTLISENTQYKKRVSTDSPFQDIKKVDPDQWGRIMHAHVQKGMSLTQQHDSLPLQDQVFDAQQKTFIPKGEVAVLSGIPFFLGDYFGLDYFERGSVFSKPPAE